MGRTITNSRAVADYFRKRHADVLRAIDNLDCSPAFNERNFASVDYLDGKGEERRSFDMTRDGWALLDISSTLTMSSREIAELTGKRHHNVMRDATNMLIELHGIEVAIKFEGYYIAANGKRNPELLLPKRETLILVSGYSVELRARIIDRWMELQRQLPRTLGGRRLPPTLGKTRRGGRPTWRMNGNRG